ncbi:MAG: hypothetical protein HRU10_12380 [Opitutales bacterium]|nr:hypothetical protein [Opitutales bacterium]
MSEDFSEFEIMKAANVSAEMAYLYSKKIGLDLFTQIRMLRSVYEMSIQEAKEVTIKASGTSKTLSEHQEKLFPALKNILNF